MNASERAIQNQHFMGTDKVGCQSLVSIKEDSLCSKTSFEKSPSTNTQDFINHEGNKMCNFVK